MKLKVLLIDDEEKLRSLLKRIITLEGYQVAEAGSIAQAKKQLEICAADIVLCDVKLPDGNGVDFTAEIKAKYPATEVLLLTAYGNIPDGIKAIQNGAFDYIVKGDDNDRIIPLLARAAEKLGLQQRVERLEAKLEKKYSFSSIIGESTAIRQAIQLAKKVAPADASVLLTGETGTGKEVFAQAIHHNSSRAAQPFVALNCSAFSSEIIESELFGHKAGAFTGAVKDKKGMVEEAKGGTLFLDEIGEMPQELQPKLLRFLENGTYYRVGETTERRSDVRLVAASNRNFSKEIEAGNFRSDLYYRIAVFTIALPSLRERKDDIPMLAAHYLRQFTARVNTRLAGISKEAMQALQQHTWPGNIRELKNVIERAVILEDTTELQITSLPYELQHPSGNAADSSSLKLAYIEQQHILKVLKQVNGNKTEAARVLDIGLATLYRKLEEYGVKS
jgi:DNA-binding NtrC family response regulator